MQQFQVDRRRDLRRRSARTEDASCPFLQLRLPGGDLVRVDIEQLGQLSERLLTLDRRQRHLRLEAGAMRPPCSFRHACS
jgi:hypothetical protein